MTQSFVGSMQMPIRYLKIFFRRKWFFLIPTVIGIIGGITTGALLPKIYESYSVVLIEEEKTLNPLIKGLAVSMSVTSRMRTIREQILGWNSLVQLVNRLNLAKDVKSQLDYEKLILKLRDKIHVRMKGPNIIRISYTSPEPPEAKKVVQTVNDIFIEENMKAQAKESSIAIDFIKDQIKVYRRKIKESEIAELRDRLEDLLIDSTEEHPIVKDSRLKMAKLKKELDEEFDVDQARPISLKGPVNDELKKQIEVATEQLIASGTSEAAEPELLSLAEVNPSKTGSNESLYKLMLLDRVDQVMARDAKVNEQIYNMLLQRLESAKITQRLEASKQGTRYTVLDPPRLPLKPIKPNKTLLVIMGLFLGSCAGFGLVVLTEFTDSSFLGIDEVKEFVDLPILGGTSKILTEEDIKNTRSRARFRAIMFIIVSIILIILAALYSFFH